MKLTKRFALLVLCLLLGLWGCDDTISDPQTGVDVPDDDDSAGDDDDSAGDDDDSAAAQVVDNDGDGFAADEDCNDDQAAVNPAAAELCDGIDNNCDGVIDQGDAADAPTWYEDTDGDGYGVAGTTRQACTQPHGFSAYPGDCDDSDPAYHPGAIEADCADPADYNCDGSVGFADADGDGVAACEDCDDSSSAISPASVETCNQLDDDCDGQVDEEGATGESSWYLDADGDGYGRASWLELACFQPTGFVANNNDCDDLDASSYPGGTEVCDGADNNCDLTVDEGVTSTFFGDADGDGYGDPSAPLVACFEPSGASSNNLDCDDAQPSVHPGGIELCDGFDNDCDSSIDQGALDAVTWYADSDGDGFGSPGTGGISCAPILGGVSNDDDCDDGDSGNYPGNAEVCDGSDNNCDFSVDEAFDADADGVTTCGPDGVAGNSDDDCDDTDIAIYPGAAETCDGSDNNCDGNSDENLVGGASLCPAQSCIDLLDTWQVTADGVYWIDPAGGGAFQVYCDMNNDGGGWTLLAKFAASGSAWRWGQGEWLSGAALAAASSLDPTTVADAKNEAWVQLTVAELRMDAVGSNSSNGPYVLFNNTATQTMAALMNASGTTLTTTAGSITSFSSIDPGFQGDAGAAGATLHTHLTSSHSLSGGCCDLANRVTLGSTHAASFSSGVHGAANAGFTGVGGTIRYRDGHNSSCCNYGLQGENDRNTSGNDIVLWGR